MQTVLKSFGSGFLGLFEDAKIILELVEGNAQFSMNCLKINRPSVSFYHGFCLQGKAMVFMPPHSLIDSLIH